MRFQLICFILLLLFSNNLLAQHSPPIQLATAFKLRYDISEYLVSEKLDGVRGFWDGKTLVTKKGNLIHTPNWFTEGWPNTSIEGELWLGRDTFESLVSCVRRKKVDQCWQNVRFMVFDLPFHKGVFKDRVLAMYQLQKEAHSEFIKVIPQIKIGSNDALYQYLDKVTKHQGEGLMLHYQNALYKKGRTSNIMKLKQYQDAEAIVLKHIPGKGKYLNQLGAIQVKTSDNIIFKIGSGFSDKERAAPPLVGSTITFKYIGKTQRGVPKFASFLRERTIQ